MYWNPVYTSENINLAYDYFETELLKILDKLAPMCKLQPRRNVTNWVSVGTRESMVLRDLARENAKKYGRNDDWSLYKRRINKCNTLVRKDRVLH